MNNTNLKISNAHIQLEAEVLESSSDVGDDGERADLGGKAINELNSERKDVADGIVEGDNDGRDLGNGGDQDDLGAVNGGEDVVNELGELDGDGVGGVSPEDDGNFVGDGLKESELVLESAEDDGELGNDGGHLLESHSLGSELSDENFDLALDGDDQSADGLEITAGELATIGDDGGDLVGELLNSTEAFSALLGSVDGDGSERGAGYVGEGSGTSGDGETTTAVKLDASTTEGTSSDTEGLDDSTSTSNNTSDDLGGITAQGGGDGEGSEGKEGESELHFDLEGFERVWFRKSVGERARR